MLDELRLGLGGEQPVPKLGLAEDQLQAVTAAEHQELERRERTCRDQRPPPEPTGKVVIVVDNGLAFFQRATFLDGVDVDKGVVAGLGAG